MRVQILDAMPRHLDGLERLEKTCFSEPWTREQLQGELPDEHHIFLLAEAEDGQILGYAAMMFVLDEGDISNVAVDPSFRKQGIGDAILGKLLERAYEAGVRFVTLEVRESNLPAIGLYQKYGFVPVGRRKKYYDLPREDAIIMKKTMK